MTMQASDSDSRVTPQQTDAAGNEPLRFLDSKRYEMRKVPMWHPLAYIIRQLPLALQRAVQRCKLPERPRILDYGCAEIPYRHFFPEGAEYLGADLPGNPDASVHIRDDGSLPVTTNTVDFVLSSQVLEHVESPARYLAEAYRVLKPGGELVLSTHGIMIYHKDPVDYWRWTGEGLQKAVRDAGFEVWHFEGVMGLGPSGLQLFQDATWIHFPRFLRSLWVLLIQSLIALLDRMHSAGSKADNALVYVVNARKPAAGLSPDAQWRESAR
ncbi:MAG: class I SAM-dependent methyltransferase [Stenotrophobium sp.]